MNTSLRLALTLLVAALTTAKPLAAGPVTTGTVTKVDEKTGAVTVLSDQTRGPVNYIDIDRTTLRFGSGEPAQFGDITVGQYVTVEYGLRGEQTVVTKFMIPNPQPGAVAAGAVAPVRPLTPAEVRALNSPAARDGDITTKPGTSARLDNDITTQPGKKALIDNDITTQPGRKALSDNDITTQPGQKALIDNDITTQPGKKALIDNDITTNPGKTLPSNRDITKKAED